MLKSCAPMNHDAQTRCSVRAATAICPARRPQVLHEAINRTARGTDFACTSKRLDVGHYFAFTWRVSMITYPKPKHFGHIENFVRPLPPHPPSCVLMHNFQSDGSGVFKST